MTLRLPKLKLTVGSVGGKNILLGMVRQTDDVLLAHLHGVLHPTGSGVEAVQLVLLRDGVDVVALRGNDARHKVAVFGNAIRKGSYDL